MSNEFKMMGFQTQLKIWGIWKILNLFTINLNSIKIILIKFLFQIQLWIKSTFFCVKELINEILKSFIL